MRKKVCIVLVLALAAACSNSEKKEVADQTAKPKCVIAPESWAVDETKNELTGILLRKKGSVPESNKQIDYVVLKLDRPVCIAGYLQNDEIFRVDEVDEIHLRVGSVDFKELIKANQRVLVRGNLIHRAKRDPGATFTEVYFSVKNVVPVNE